jgi:sporulation protein YlmC with PRC-barrel domain
MDSAVKGFRAHNRARRHVACTALGMDSPMDPERAALARVERLDVISLADVIDRPIIGPDGAEVGTVVNVYADLAAHQLRYALISIGGVLGIGAKRVLVPFAVLSWTDDDLVLPVARDVLDRAPAWDDENALDADSQAEVVTYWGTDRSR